MYGANVSDAITCLQTDMLINRPADNAEKNLCQDLLLQWFHEVKSQHQQYLKPLHHAIAHGHVDKVKSILKKTKNLALPSMPSLLEQTNKLPQVPSVNTLKRDEVVGIESDNLWLINGTSKRGYNSILLACRHGYLEILCLLLSHATLLTAAHLPSSVTNNNNKVVDQHCSLASATESSDISSQRLILGIRCCANTTPLMEATVHNHEHIVRYLLQLGECNSQDQLTGDPRQDCCFGRVSFLHLAYANKSSMQAIHFAIKHADNYFHGVNHDNSNRKSNVVLSLLLPAYLAFYQRSHLPFSITHPHSNCQR
jgi:ankyrin repeat protein